MMENWAKWDWIFEHYQSTLLQSSKAWCTSAFLCGICPTKQHLDHQWCHCPLIKKRWTSSFAQNQDFINFFLAFIIQLQITMFDTCYYNISEVGSKNKTDEPSTSCIPSTTIGWQWFNHRPFTLILIQLWKYRLN